MLLCILWHTMQLISLVGWWLVGCRDVFLWNSRTDGLDAWYSDWPQPTTHCVEIGDFRLTVHVGISGVLTNTSHWALCSCPAIWWMRLQLADFTKLVWHCCYSITTADSECVWCNVWRSNAWLCETWWLPVRQQSQSFDQTAVGESH